jgi:hypothetical protein
MHLMFVVASTVMLRDSERRPIEALAEAPLAPRPSDPRLKVPASVVQPRCSHSIHLLRTLVTSLLCEVDEQANTVEIDVVEGGVALFSR